MTEARDPLAAFDDAVIAAVAEESGIDEKRLRELLRRHQGTARDLPGVDDLVYEWRRHFGGGVLLERTDTAYYLSLGRSVWGEFAEALEFSPAELAAVMAVHDRQTRRRLGDDAADPDGEWMVLTRE